MRYRSTRSNGESVDSMKAVLEGLSPDGGLYMPAVFPKAPDFYRSLIGKTFAEMAEMDAEQLAKARENLLRYCELDTYAMVVLWKKLKEI